MPPKGKTTPKSKADKKIKSKKAAPQKTEESSEGDSSEDDSGEDSDEPVPAPVTKSPGGKKQKLANGKVVKGAKVEEKEAEADSSEDEESEEEEAPKAKKTPQKSPKAAAPKAKAAEESEEEESSDDDGSEESEEEQSKKGKKDAKAKAKSPKVEPAKVKPAQESEEEDSEEEESGEESEEEEMDVEKEKTKKRKKDSEGDQAAKKAKVDTVETEKKATLFVNNLPEEIEEKKVMKFFKKNDIGVAEVRLHPKKPMCWVDLENAEDLAKGIALSGQELKGNELKIEEANPPKKVEQANTPRSNRNPEFEKKDTCTLFVKNLSYEVTEDAIREHFDGVQDIRMPKRDDGSAKGFAFLEFSSEEEVTAALEAKQGTEIYGRAITLDYAGTKSKFGGSSRGGGTPNRRPQEGAEPGQTKVLFVKNLSFDTTVESLQDAFENATTARVCSHADTGKPRGFGFVEFHTAEEASSAYEAMQGQEIDGRQVVVDYAAEKREGGGGGGGWRGGRGGGRGFGGGRGGGRGFGGGFGGGRGGGGRGGRGGGGFRGGRGGRGGGSFNRSGIQDFKGSRKSFGDDD